MTEAALDAVVAATMESVCGWPFESDVRAALSEVPNGWAKVDGKWFELEPIYDLRCWTCGNGQPASTTSLCNEAHDVHRVLIGARAVEVTHP